MYTTSALSVEERVVGDTKWVAVRARGAEWSWLTVEEAAELGRLWAAHYEAPAKRDGSGRGDLRLVHAA